MSQQSNDNKDVGKREHPGRLKLKTFKKHKKL